MAKRLLFVATVLRFEVATGTKFPPDAFRNALNLFLSYEEMSAATAVQLALVARCPRDVPAIQKMQAAFSAFMRAEELAAIEAMPGFDPDDNIGSLAEIDHKSKMIAQVGPFEEISHKYNSCTSRVVEEPSMDDRDFSGM